MINLLPPATKEEYYYAHRNVSLIRWVSAFLLGFGGLIIIGTAGLLYMSQSVNTYEKQIAHSSDVLKDQKLADTQIRVKEITGNFKLVVKVLSKEVLFSKLLKQMAAAIPANASLTDLNINQTQGALDITALAADYNTATQVQVNLADPANKIFAKADILNVTCGSKTTDDSRYPCTVTIRALFGDNNPFLFINNGSQQP